jgi:hypothetical protein
MVDIKEAIVITNYLKQFLKMSFKTLNMNRLITTVCLILMQIFSSNFEKQKYNKNTSLTAHAKLIEQPPIFGINFFEEKNKLTQIPHLICLLFDHYMF